MKYEITTEVEEEKIVQKLVIANASELFRWICDTREKGVREALVSLGWTPPAIAQHLNEKKEDVNNG